MRIAFDVKGTIEGPKKELVLKLFRGLQAKGHTCVVWSNSYMYAIDAVVNNGLENTEAMYKKSKSDMADDGLELFDLAIEDDLLQTYLGAKKLLFVVDLTEETVAELLG